MPARPRHKAPAPNMPWLPARGPSIAAGSSTIPIAACRADSTARRNILEEEVAMTSKNRRLLEPIGNIPPAEAEERYYAMLDQPAMAA